MRDIEKLKDFLSQPQEILKGTLESLLRENNYNPISREGYLYAEGDIPLLLVAHLDTEAEKEAVEKNESRANAVPKKDDIVYDEIMDVVKRAKNANGVLGGDDRCGVYAIMEIIKKYRPSILFTEDEERGLLGAEKAVIGLRTLKDKYKYIIEIDRRGNGECVFYQCGNIDFINYITKFGFNWEIGTNSDIALLGRCWDIAATNVSAGYHQEHSIYEYISMSELEETIKKIEAMIRDIDNVPFYKYMDTLGQSESADFKEYVPTYKYKPKDDKKPLDNGGDE